MWWHIVFSSAKAQTVLCAEKTSDEDQPTRKWKTIALIDAEQFALFLYSTILSLNKRVWTQLHENCLACALNGANTVRMKSDHPRLPLESGPISAHQLWFDVRYDQGHNATICKNQQVRSGFRNLVLQSLSLCRSTVRFPTRLLSVMNYSELVLISLEKYLTCGYNCSLDWDCRYTISLHCTVI